MSTNIFLESHDWPWGCYSPPASVMAGNHIIHGIETHRLSIKESSDFFIGRHNIETYICSEMFFNLNHYKERPWSLQKFFDDLISDNDFLEKLTEALKKRGFVVQKQSDLF